MTVMAEHLPNRFSTITARHIALGAFASRDWQPQHHDHAHAVSAGLPDIILNTPAQIGWFSAYLTDWTGPEARIARWRLRMIAPIVPGMKVKFAGEARTVSENDGMRWIDVALSAHVDAALCSSARFLAALPGENGNSPWNADADVWKPPTFSPSGS